MNDGGGSSNRIAPFLRSPVGRRSALSMCWEIARAHLDDQTCMKAVQPDPARRKSGWFKAAAKALTRATVGN